MSLKDRELKKNDAKDVAQNEVLIQKTENTKLLYRIEDSPDLFMTVVFGFQQAVMCVPGSLAVPFFMTKKICAAHLPAVTAKILSVSFFMCGISTFLQDTFGVRLPIVQGGSAIFLPPIIAMMSLDRWECPTEDLATGNDTMEAAWMPRMREIQGNLILASLTQLLLGCTGLIGFLLRFIGPLTIAPTISLIGLSLTRIVNEFCQAQWGIAIFTAFLVFLFSMCLGQFSPPFPGFTRERGCHVTRYPIFQLIRVLLAMGLSWTLCYVLTVTEVLPNNSTEPGYLARTDATSRLEAVENAPWLYFPYPFQLGMPTVSVAGYIGMLAATLGSVIESVGDYFAAARVSEVPPPPAHAINRGTAVEGFACILSGMLGTGHGTTSYTNNIGVIAVTKVASRRVFQAAGAILVLCGVFGKFGAVITLIPEPVIGGVMAVLLGLVTAVGISTLQFTDLSSTRNMTILGLAMNTGLCIPMWIHEHPDAINTGITEVDHLIKVLLGTALFVGGIIGCILDNLVPVQLGMPTVSVAGYIGMLAATLGSVIESVGDYFAAARVSEVPPPPAHAINRGTAVEGFACILSGMLGTGHGTTSYTNNIGVIAVTKVASRRVFQAAGAILVLCGVFGKFGAVITLIPEPVIGGVMAVLLGLVTAVGISTLQFTDLSSTRNMTILGLAMNTGLCIPMWIHEHPDAINTGITEVDHLIKVLLGTALFVGGIIGCILDNLVPGTLEERGLLQWRQYLGEPSESSSESVDRLQVYDLPCISKYIKMIACCAYIPFMSSYTEKVKKRDTAANQKDSNDVETQHASEVS